MWWWYKLAVQLMCYPGTSSMHVDLKFNLILEWFDHKVGWVNLKAEDHLNTLSNQELEELWLPKVLLFCKHYEHFNEYLNLKRIL